MNKIYRLVWNATLGAWVAVCEFARARGKGKRGGARAARSRPAAGFAGRMGWRGCAAAVALACAGGSGAALAAGRGILAEIDGAAVTVGADGYGLDGGSTPDCGSVTTTDGCRDGDGVDMKWTVANSALNTLIEIKNGGALILGSGLELYVSGSGNAGASTVAVDGSGSEYRQTGGTANINHGFLLTGGALLTLSGGALNANVAGGANGGNIELRGAGTAMNVSGGALNMNGGAILLGIDNIGATAFTLSGGSVGAGKIQIGQASAMNVAGGQTSVGAIQVDGRLNLTGGAASLGTAGGSDAIAGAGQIDVSGGNTTIWGNAAGFTGTLTGTGGALTTKAAMGAATISLGSNTQYTAEGALAANSIVIETGADMVLHAAAPNANVTVRDAGSTLKVEGNGKLGAGKTLTVDDDGAATLVGNAADTLASPKAGHVVIGAGGGTLDLQGAGVLAKSLDSAGAGIVKITGTGAKTIDGDVSLTAGDTLDFSSASLGAPDPLLTITGDLSGAASVDAGMNFRNDPANNNLLAWDDPAGLDTVLLRVRGDYDGGLVIGSMGGAIVQTTSAKAAWESDAYYASKQGTVAQATVTGSGVSATCAAPSGSGGTDCAIGANSVLDEIAIEDGKTLALRPDGVAATTSDDNTLTAKLTQAPGDTGNVAVIAGTGAVTLS
ncbi:MAG: ESPR domain-containing protein, partial [Candidatus Accumulibacter sp.]|nr:ESPR domain-containing protein [Accumulibacter sp.]